MPKINTSGQPSYEGHEGVVTTATGEQFSVGRGEVEDAPFEPTLREPEETQEETREREKQETETSPEKQETETSPEKEESSPGSSSPRSASSSAKTQQQSKNRR